jgi:RHS repeat-associated protein
MGYGPRPHLNARLIDLRNRWGSHRPPGRLPKKALPRLVPALALVALCLFGLLAGSGAAAVPYEAAGFGSAARTAAVDNSATDRDGSPGAEQREEGADTDGQGAELLESPLLGGVALQTVDTTFALFNSGDVFVGGSTFGTINHYNSQGTLVDTLNTGARWQVTGICFDEFGDLYATNFSDQTITKFDDSGHVLQTQWGGFLNGRPESCVVDSSGNVYVGMVDTPSPGNELLKFNQDGSLLAGWRPDTNWRGTDWMDLSADNCTLLYTSEYFFIKRFNVCTGTQMADWADPGDGPCYGVRIEPNGEVVAACIRLVRLNADATVISRYDYGYYSLFGLALDRTGDTAWITSDPPPSGGAEDLLHVNLSTGSVLSQSTPAEGAVAVAVYGSVQAGTPGSGGIPPGAPPPEATYGPCEHSRAWYRGKGRVLAACLSLAADPVNLATGAVSSSVTDAKMPSLGEAFAFERSYTSLDVASGELGVGWTASYADRLTFGPETTTWRSGSGAQLVFSQQLDGSYEAPAWAAVSMTAGGGAYEIIDAEQRHYSFDDQGRLTAVKDRNGEGVTLAYDPQGNRSSLTDSAGRTVTFEHDAQSLLTRLLLPDGRDVRYGYTGGYLTSVTDLRGNTYGYTYDAQGRLWTEVDQNGHQVVKNTYGDDGRISQQEDANQNITQFAWNPDSQTATVTDARNNARTWTFNSTLLTRQADPYGNTVHYVYDAATGDLTKIRDALGHVETMTYDSRHNMLTRTAPSPLNDQELWTYNSLDEPLSHRDGRLNQTDYQYDAVGNLTVVTGPDPDGGGPLGRPVTTYTLDPAGTGLVISVTDPRLKTTQFGYEPTTHERTSITTPLGNKTTFSFDATGRLGTSVEPRGNVTGGTPGEYTTSYGYDDADHQTTVTSPDPDGTGPQTPLVTQWAYDLAGNLQTFTSAKGQPTDYGYDAANHLTSVTAPDPDGAGPLQRPVTQYTYDAVGNRASRTVGGTHTTTYGYDDANRLSSLTSPTGQLWTYGYDANGDRSSQLDANGGTTSYGHDPLGRLTSLNFSDSTPSVSFAYDANDNIIQVNDGAGNETRTYDALNALSGVTRGSSSFAYVYDAAGNLTQTTYPGATSVTRGYDNDERLTSVASGGQTTGYGYDAASNVTTTTLPSGNGYAETRTYDHAGRLTGVTNKKGTTTLSAFAWTLDADGNPSTSVRTGAISETDTYTYDNLDRLMSVCFQASCPGGNDPFIRWTYDDVGNRLSEARPSGSKTYTYNASDQLTQAGPTTYTYDGNGNEKTAGSTTFNYNLLNQLVSTTTGSTTTTYSYDGLGKRLQASTGSQASKKTNYLWDVSNDLAQIGLERDGNNSLLRRYIYGARRISMTSGNSSYYFHYDPVGSVVNMTSSTGASQWTDSYEPYGLIHSETKNNNQAPTTFMKFAGEYLDPTGLYHLRARQYDAAIGRFTTKDPLAPIPTSPYVSAYAYTSDMPTTLIDPSGMRPGNTCGSIKCWFKQKGEELNRTVIKVSAGCLVGAAAGEEAIGGPLGYRIAAAFSPEAALLLPAGGCLAGAVGAGVEAATGYEGPSTIEPPVPLGP